LARKPAMKRRKIKTPKNGKIRKIATQEDSEPIYPSKGRVLVQKKKITFHTIQGARIHKDFLLLIRLS
jgi:hypothetical protein